MIASASTLTPAEGLEDVGDDRRVRRTSNGHANLIAWLADTGMTTDVLAKRCGVLGGAIRNLTSGKTVEPKLKLAFALKRETGIPADAWLEEQDSIVTRVTGRRGKP